MKNKKCKTGCVLCSFFAILFLKIFFSPSAYSTHKICFSISINLLRASAYQSKVSGVAWEVETSPKAITVNLFFYLKCAMNYWVSAVVSGPIRI